MRVPQRCAAVWIVATSLASAQSAPTEPDSQAVRALLARLATIDVSDAAFRRLDTDHDGRISALEANANPKVAARFLEADRNRDGYLSPEEFRTLGNGSPPNAAADTPPRPAAGAASGNAPPAK